MPRKRVHTMVGATAGGITAIKRSAEELPSHQVLEGLGGVIGGYLGGRFPDVLEPADSSWHRGPLHSGAALALMVAAGNSSILDKWESGCRSRAEHHRKAQLAAGVSTTAGLVHFLAELFWRVMAGVLVGFGAGYVSHLALDGFDARSLPVFG